MATAGKSGKATAKESKAPAKAAAKEGAGDSDSLVGRLEALLRGHYEQVEKTWNDGEAQAREAYDRCVQDLQALASGPQTFDAAAKATAVQEAWLAALGEIWGNTQRTVAGLYRRSLQGFQKALAAAKPEELDPTTLWSIASALAGVASQACAFGVGQDGGG
jgi:hypothetical protein